jgi:hypothetical protein
MVQRASVPCQLLLGLFFTERAMIRGILLVAAVFCIPSPTGPGVHRNRISSQGGGCASSETIRHASQDGAHVHPFLFLLWVVFVPGKNILIFACKFGPNLVELSLEVHMFPGLQPRLPGAHPVGCFLDFRKFGPNLVELSLEVHMFPGLQPRLPGAPPIQFFWKFGHFFKLVQI